MRLLFLKNEKYFISFFIILFSLLFSWYYSSTPENTVYANCPTECYWHPTLQVCTGYDGCRAKGSGCYSYEFEVQGTWCCDKCESSCTGCGCSVGCSGTYNLTSCPSGHTCSSTTNSCTKVDSCGNACGGTNSITCYKDNGPICTPGCNACANYSYLSTSNYGYGSKNVSCVDDCGDTDWDTCYCNSCSGTCDPECPSNHTTNYTACGSMVSFCSVANNCTSSCKMMGQVCYLATRTVNFYSGPGGYISGSSSQNVCYGSDTGYVTAVPNPGYYFTHWNDGSTNATRRVTDVTSNTSRTAYFSTYTYDVAYDSNGGSCSPSTVTVNYGGSAGPPSCSRSGYNLTGFTRTIGSCGSLDTTTGYVSNVICNLGIRANWCNNAPCDPLDSNSCPEDTSVTGTHGYFSTLACNNDCGDLSEVDCNCINECTLPDCPQGTSEDNTDNDKIEYTDEPIFCQNKCLETRVKACYCDHAQCSDLTSEVEWLDECPDGSCRSVTRSTPVPDYAESCPSSEEIQCFIDNARPEVPNVNKPENGLDVKMPMISLTNSQQTVNTPLLQKLVSKVNAQAEQDSILGYSSDTHSGRDLNNPLNVTVEYSDDDGVDDLEALYVWWSTSETKDFTTPNQLGDGTYSGMTEDNENFGFLITRHINGNWENLYRPHIDGGDTLWVPEGSSPSSDSITILGQGGEDMVNISNVTVTTEGNTATLEFLVEFLWDGENIEQVVDASYNIWSLANDTVGFLPFGDDEIIEDSEDEYWKDSGNDWIIDLERPVVTEVLNIAHVTDSNIAVRFGARDDENDLARVRLDACRTLIEDDYNPLIVDGRQYNMPDCNNVNWGTQYPSDLDMDSGGDLLGIDPTNPDVPEYGYSDPPLDIDLNENQNGSITFHFTFMDEAGNWRQSIDILKLGEWVAVEDGFVYGADGVSSSTRKLDEGWDNDPLITQYGFQYGTIDLTDNVLLGGNTSVSSFLGDLERTEENSSFKASRYPGIFINSPYADFMGNYDDRIVEGAISNYGEINVDSPNLSGDILDHLSCEGNDYCILRKEGDLEIDEGSSCGGNGLVAVNGNLTMNPDFKNVDNSDRCIFIVSGDVTIAEGNNPDDTNPTVVYDVIEGFIVANGQISIAEDGDSDGLIVQGGLAAFNENDARTGISNSRTLQLDSRNKHPVIAVQGNAKYGLLSRILFGTPIDIFRGYIGFKPY